MKKYHFRLEPLLNVRKHVEKQRQKELAAAVQQVNAQKAHIDKLAAKKIETAEAQRGIQGGKLSVYQLQSYSRYFVLLKKEAMAGQELLRGFERDADQKRRKLIEAAKQRKIFEKLKDTQQTKFYKDIDEAEKKEADEIGLNSFRLNQKK